MNVLHELPCDATGVGAQEQRPAAECPAMSRGDSGNLFPSLLHRSPQPERAPQQPLPDPEDTGEPGQHEPAQAEHHRQHHEPRAQQERCFCLIRQRIKQIITM
jgi:hypothetical protein